MEKSKKDMLGPTGNDLQGNNQISKVTNGYGNMQGPTGVVYSASNGSSIGGTSLVDKYEDKKLVLEHILYEIDMFLSLNMIDNSKLNVNEYWENNSLYIAEKISLRNLMDFFHYNNSMYFNDMSCYKIYKIDKSKIESVKSNELAAYSLFENDEFEHCFYDIEAVGYDNPIPYYGRGNLTIKSCVDKTIAHLTDNRFESILNDNYERVLENIEIHTRIVKDITNIISDFISKICVDYGNENLYYIYKKGNHSINLAYKDLTEELGNVHIKGKLDKIKQKLAFFK